MSDGGPILVFGITQRSGTHFLQELLLRHPRVVGAQSILDEDYLVEMSDALELYARVLARRWHNSPRAVETRPLLLESLGDGLGSYLTRLHQIGVNSGDEAAAADYQTGIQLVTKSPTAVNLRRAFQIFPRGRVLVLIRDPRSVVESGMKGLGWSFEQALDNWSRGAAEIAAAETSRDWRAAQARLVRYEDLVADTRHEVERLLEFLDLPVEEYPADAAEDVPVIGSSFFFPDGRTEDSTQDTFWAPVARDATFQPLARRTEWSARMRSRLEWTCGESARRFGYDLDPAPDAPWVGVDNRVADLVHGLHRRSRRLARRVVDAAQLVRMV